MESKKKAPKISAQEIRSHFPVLLEKVYGKSLVYLDNAATTQKPREVIDRLKLYYEHENANIHRGIHFLAEKATVEYENVRKKTAAFINAEGPENIIFTSGTTMGLNLIASTWGREYLSAGDAVMVSEMEHHSNLVPWHLLAKEKGIEIRSIPVTDAGEMDLTAFKAKLDAKVKLVSVTHMSNVLGTVNPVKEIVAAAKDNGSVTVIDGAQGVPHIEVDVKDIGCDFYVFSAHKMLGPTGVGVLYGKKEILENMPPYMGGGEMIKDVYMDSSTYAALPHKFEAGTPNIGGVIGFGAALDFLTETGIANIGNIERELTVYALEKMKTVPGMEIFGSPQHRGGVISFNIKGIHPMDLAQYADSKGIAMRTGHHCAQPLLCRFGIKSLARVSFYAYNLPEEIDYLTEVLRESLKFFKVDR